MVELKRLREKNKMKSQEVADYLGVTRQAYSNYENGNRQPGFEVLLKLAELYGTTVDAILRPDAPAPDGTVSDADLDLIKKIRALDEHGKRMINLILDEETRRLREKGEPLPTKKIIPLFGTAAAAGPGEPDTGMPWEDHEVSSDSKAEFAVRISGDSMEPVLHDGQVALCVKRKPEIGELAVIMVNGSLLCKQFITDGRNIYLRSINRARKDCDYDIWESGSDTVQCFGTVLTKHIALVDQ